ncbi:MAG: bifunctional phosphoribosyl-AMP cyclohydrolase/phosphoribosyl-ATP diphosphatase HisIE [Lachnospiraceae bacterium]
MVKVIACVLLKNGEAYLPDGSIIKDAAVYCQACANSGADEILFVDTSDSEKEHHNNLAVLKNLSRNDLGFFTAGGTCTHIDDVKKYLYTGAGRMYFAPGADPELIKESISRFGTERTACQVATADEALRAYELGIRIFYCLNLYGNDVAMAMKAYEDTEVYCLADNREPVLNHGACGLIYSIPEEKAGRVMDYKQQLLHAGYEVNIWKPVFDWEDFKLNNDGLLPVVVQDWKNDEVLMVAYMNEEAYRMTVQTGRMTYFSRSRQSLWIKGETSGHYQYVKSLKIDCDEDTLLARVVQVGAACHTGSRSCFYRDIVSRGQESVTAYKVLESVYNTIMDRKQNPKEGSYTNYLFSKGLDKILKKVGEEATEIVIAAKNPDAQDIVYELGDFLYHVMVLMAEKGITWEDVARELADRE